MNDSPRVFKRIEDEKSKLSVIYYTFTRVHLSQYLGHNNLIVKSDEFDSL